MRRAGLLAFAGALAWAAGPAAGAVSLREPDVDAYPTVRLTLVTSTPSAARPRLWEAGRPVFGLAAENLAAAKSVVLAIDRSRSMAGAPIASASAGGLAFVASKPPSDRLAIVAFGVGAAQLTRFSAARAEAQRTLAGLAVDRSEGTALHDGLALASRLLGEEQAAGKVVILLTDGHDVSSAATLGSAIAAAREAQAIVYPIALRGATFAPEPLARIARATGGRLHVAASETQLPSIFTKIAEELRRTWRVEYSTRARPGERVAVRAVVPGMGAAATRLAVPGGALAADPPSGIATTAWGDLLLGAATGALVLAAVYRVASYRRMRWLETRLAPAAAEAAEPRPRRSLRARVSGAGRGLFGATERSFGGLNQWQALQGALDRGDVPLRAVELLYAMLGSGVVLALLAATAGAPALVVLLFLACGAAAPYLLVARRARRRRRAFEEQLPDLLMTLASSLKAGHSFRQGLQTLVDEGQDPARREFRRVLSEARLGRPVEEALADMAERLGSDNFTFVVSAVAVQREVGGSLAGIFDMVAEAVRERQQFARRVKAITAQGRMSAYVLVGLPFFLFLVLNALNPDYMRVLYTTSAGTTLIVVALVLMGLGALFLRRVVAVR
jgi:tight adherence protein B